MPRRVRPRAGDDGEQRALARVPAARAGAGGFVDAHAARTASRRSAAAISTSSSAPTRRGRRPRRRRPAAVTGLRAGAHASTRSRRAAPRSITTCKNQQRLRGPEEGAGDDARRRSSKTSRSRACAAAAAPASRPASSGSSSTRSRRSRSTSSATPTRASRAPSRTTC